MTSEELGGLVFLLGYLALLVLAVKVFGFRRVLMVFFWIVVFAFVVAFKSLGAIAGNRRY